MSMSVTEAEARTMWCPMARVGNSGRTVSVNREVDRRGPGYLPHPGALCIASTCMAWTWTYRDEFERASTDIALVDQHTGDALPPSGGGWVRDGGGHGKAYWKRASGTERTGYCGMADRG